MSYNKPSNMYTIEFQKERSWRETKKYLKK